MKLLNKTEAESSKKKENDLLIESNLRLKQIEISIKRRIERAKSNFDPEKLKALVDFEKFTEELNQKKSLMLKEMNDIQGHIDAKKDIYYGLVEKQDMLEEKMYQMSEKEKKLDLRESFVNDLERKFKEKL
jgi:hypothetical protein